MATTSSSFTVRGMHTNTPAYRAPWTHGAKAYPEADTFEALAAGIARKRKPLTVLVSHDACGDMPCAACGRALGGEYEVNPGAGDLRTDTLGRAYFDCNPRTGIAVGRHYYCAWGATMRNILDPGRAIQLKEMSMIEIGITDSVDTPIAVGARSAA